MTASIWSGSGIIASTANADNSYLQQQFTGAQGIVSAGNTTFMLTTFAYAPGTNSLDVYISGVHQDITSNYLETSGTSVTILGLVDATDDILIKGLVGSTGATSAAASAAAAAAALAAIQALNIPNLPLVVASGGTGATTAAGARTALNTASRGLTGFDEISSAGAPIASAANVNLDTATGDYIHISGAVAINGFTLGAGKERTIVFDGAPVLTNGASLIIPGGTNLAMAAGNIVKLRAEAANSIRIESITKADGTAVVGSSSGLTLLATLIPVNGATNVNFLNVFSALYDDYLIIGKNIIFAGAANINMEVAVAGVLDNANNYSNNGFTNTGSTPLNASSFIVSNAVFTPGSGGNFEITLLGANSAFAKSFICHSTFQTSATNYDVKGSMGVYGPASILTGVGFMNFSGGQTFLAQGSIKVYGIQR